MIETRMNRRSRRLIARLAVSGAVVALPLAVVVSQASAETPAVVQASDQSGITLDNVAGPGPGGRGGPGPGGQSGPGQGGPGPGGQGPSHPGGGSPQGGNHSTGSFGSS
ncbi:hypothetical protein [Nocardia sp. NPDC056100]|uniref:hypothetical protein n=1 Tax=Nocardia sp. NPDC056100 TaxID=3345712 RepID=UPI0035D6A0FF